MTWDRGTHGHESGGREGRCCGAAGGSRPGRGREGLIEPLVLVALTSGSAHGYDLIQSVETIAEGAVKADPGGLYRTLRRLEESGLVRSMWVEGDSGPQRREYAITSAGREALGWWQRHLSARAQVFQRIADAAGAVVSAGDKERS
ncbi:MAG: PadR family transcriptional regulator [Coriobacteriales bacterium]